MAGGKKTRRTIMTDWTPSLVEDRLEEAADVLKRLPEQRVQGYFNVWPDMVRSFADKVGQMPVPMRRPPPSAASISRMDETMMWVGYLDVEDARLVWMRAERKHWKEICWGFGISRSTAIRRHKFALSVIALRLNGLPVTTKRSRSFVIKSAERLSIKIVK
jgi:hypothetical protein